MNLHSTNTLIAFYSSEQVVIKNRELVVAFILLVLFILTFNYPDVFIAKSLYLDDFHRYTLGLENKIHPTILARNFARAYVIFPLFKLMSIDVVLARLALVVFFYIPLSLSIYYLLRKFAKVAPIVALFSSLLPAILPGQLQIPYFIDGSYTVQGLLVYIFSLIISLKFISNNQFSWILFLSSALLYFFSIEMMDHAIFLLPFSIISFILISSPSPKLLRIIALTVINILLASYKIVQTLAHPISVSAPVEPSWQQFYSRLTDFVHTVLPFSYTYKSNINETIIIGSGFLLITLLSFYFANRRERTLIVLGLFWVFSTSIVFLTISRFYSPRYAHIAGYGINFVVVLSFWTLFGKLKSFSYRYTTLLALLVVLSIFSGLKRYQNANKIILPQNNVYESIVHDLKKYNIPVDAQLVIVEGYRVPTGGWWAYSSGFMKFATGRSDLTGIIGIEKSFYDPFGIDKRVFKWKYQMSGLDLAKPILLFRQYCKKVCVLKQKRYALQWNNPSWNLYKFDLKTGELINKSEGDGYDEYVNYINNLALTEDDIVFSKGVPEYIPDTR